MGLDHSLVGVPSEPQVRSWDSKDALLYAVGVGAGLGDPLQELEFTTENSEGLEQKVLPTFAVLIAQARPSRSLGDFDRAMLVHAEQAFELHRPLPVAGTVRTVSTVTGIYDKIQSWEPRFSNACSSRIRSFRSSAPTMRNGMVLATLTGSRAKRFRWAPASWRWWIAWMPWHRTGSTAAPSRWM